MNAVFEWATGVVGRALGQVWHTFTGVWPFLLISIVVAAALTTYIGADRLASALRANVVIAVVGAVALAAFTPFCSCGTTAVVLGALASRVPWAPLAAFMVASPLTSPQEYVLSAGLFGWPFANTFFIAAIVLGLAAGAVTHAIERTGALAGQARLRPAAEAETGCCATTPPAAPANTPACCTTENTAAGGPPVGSTLTLTSVTVVAPVTWRARFKVDALAQEIGVTARRLALYFFAFATVGYLLIEAVPTAWISQYLGGSSPWSVVIAAVAGIPVYLNTDGALPMVAALMHGGMGPGPALAFLVTGAGTSIGAISGMFVIARAGIVALVIGCLLAGALLLGWTAPLWL
ncbi:permease [Catelliglobosispora koreensis]|uniref:permease n=1 Tax=Catelliglobosispora koreensis TaxID=129052 RepID=UPI0003704143|nr:permease [Catelliglobosispora koreensis]